MNLVKWLYPGMHVKRWLLLQIVGVSLISLGVAYILAHLYRAEPFPEFVGALALQFIDRPLRGILFIVAGVALIGLAIMRLNQSVLSAFDALRDESIVDVIYERRCLMRGPRVVAIGGGTGLSTLLRGLKRHTSNLTAIVTVADDGGSSGRLRRELGVPPPGDFRQCLVAMSEVEPLTARLFQYRFREGIGLDGHSFGNLFIVALAAVTGSFERAIRESCRVLAVRGQVLPSTMADVTLCAEFEDEDRIRGESRITKTHKAIRRVFLDPPQPPAYAEAIRSILHADLIVIGPGSLYTSVLPNLLVGEIACAVKSSKATKIYVCNVATERGETDHFSVEDHVRALLDHVGPGVLDCVLANENLSLHLPPEFDSQPVSLGEGTARLCQHKLVLADVVDPASPTHHDPEKLAEAVMQIYCEMTQSTRERLPIVPEEALVVRL